MIYLLILGLIHFSFLGYCNFLRRKIRMHWTNVVFFGVCALALLMMLTGILHVIKIATYIVFLGGLLLTLLDIFRSQKRWELPLPEKLTTLFFRPEYLFLALFSAGSFWILLQYKIELAAGDTWSAWYRQYYYIVLNGRWADSGYHNYASAYAMILNGVAYYFGTIFQNYGTQVYCFAHFWFAMMSLMPIFTVVKWHSALSWEVLLLSFGMLAYRLYGNDQIPTVFFVAWSVVGVYWCIRLLTGKNIRVHLQNSVLLFLGITLCAYLLSFPLNLLTYPFDTNLGCACAGTFFCVAQGLFFSRSLKRYRYFLALPLMVLSLIKPTGMIPAQLLVLAIIPWEIGKFCQFLRKLRDGCENFSFFRRHKRKIIQLALAILFVGIAPLISYKAWNCYASSVGLNYQHKVSAGDLLKKMQEQIKNGISEEDLSQWHKRIRGMSRISPNYTPQKNRTPIEQVLETFCKDFFTQHPAFDFDGCFAQPSVWNSHVGIVSFLLLLTAIFYFLFGKKKMVYLYLICWGILAYAVFVFNQYYLAPMFTNIPGLFRYFYPVYAFVLAICFCGIFNIWSTGRTVRGIIICGILGISLAPHFFAKINDPFEKFYDLSQSEVGDAMLAYLNADQTIHLGNPWDEGCIAYCYKSYLFPERDKIPLHLPEKLPKPLLIVIGKCARSSIWKYPADAKPGMYWATGDQATHQLSLKPVFSNQDAVALLNQVYHFSDPRSWSRPPWIEHDLFSLPDKNNWTASPAESRPYFSECGNTLKIFAREKSCVLYHNSKFFFFMQDKIRISGKVSHNMPIRLELDILEKNNVREAKKWHFLKRENLTIDWHDLKSGEKEFCAEFELSNLKISAIDSYFQLKIILAPEADGELYDLHLQQYVSGKLNLEPVLKDLGSETSQIVESAP